MKEVSLNFEPQAVSHWFGEIMKLAHGSGNENPLREQLYKWLTEKDYGIGIAETNVWYQRDATEPGKRVIRVYRPGTSSNLKPVVLQAHMDMVVVTNPKGVDPFPLQPDLGTDGWLKALGNGSTPEKPIGSTLGADDGIGLATALALLQDEELKQHPIECLFTVQEETDMGGAENFDTNLLTGRTYINLDDERGGTITFGSAGGFKTTYKRSIKREEMKDASRCVKVVISGLRGGHSGVDIAKGRPSAIKLLVEGLSRMHKTLNDFSPAPSGLPGSYDFQLISFARTDEIKSNAIPTEATVILAVNAADAIPLMQSFERWFAAVRTVYQLSEPNLRIELASIAGPPPEKGPMTSNDTVNLLSFLRLVPQGVIGVIPNLSPPVVETSSNLYDVIFNDFMVKIDVSTRTSSATLLGKQEAHLLSPLNVMFTGLGEAYGFTVETGNDWYPAWPPKTDEQSPLLRMAKQVYGEVYDKEYNATVIHAGLECGWIVSRYDDAMDCIAIGPTIENPHTTDERLDTRSVGKFYAAVKKLLKNVFTAQESTAAATG